MEDIPEKGDTFPCFKMDTVSTVVTLPTSKRFDFMNRKKKERNN